MHLMYGWMEYTHSFRECLQLFGVRFSLSHCWPPLGRTVAILLLSLLFAVLLFVSFPSSLQFQLSLILSHSDMGFTFFVCVYCVRVPFSFICFLWLNNIVWNSNSTFVLLHLPVLLSRREKIGDDAYMER